MGSELTTGFEIRAPRESEMDQLYQMGFDTWSDGMDLETFLAQSRDSLKYKKGQWFVLAGEGDRLLAKLIVYPVDLNAESITVGFGSIATRPEERKKGYASFLIENLLRRLEATNEAGPGVDHVFLFSDISPDFYTRLGFHALPKQHQTRPGSVCMVRSRHGLTELEILWNSADFKTPAYF